LGFGEQGSKVKLMLEESRARGKMVSLNQLSHNLIFSIMGLSVFVLIVTFGDF